MAKIVDVLHVRFFRASVSGPPFTFKTSGLDETRLRSWTNRVKSKISREFSRQALPTPAFGEPLGRGGRLCDPAIWSTEIFRHQTIERLRRGRNFWPTCPSKSERGGRSCVRTSWRTEFVSRGVSIGFGPRSNAARSDPPTRSSMFEDW